MCTRYTPDTPSHPPPPLAIPAGLVDSLFSPIGACVYMRGMVLLRATEDMLPTQHFQEKGRGVSKKGYIYDILYYNYKHNDTCYFKF